MPDERKLINKKEKQSTYLQILGFSLIIIGVSCILISLIPGVKPSGKEFSMIFFIVMLGVAFSFPALLEDQNKGLSTMRLVTFMMVNVICILMIKIGWEQSSFDAIGLDSYWVGIIAFVFGAKATQTYFESKLAVPPVDSQAASASATPDTIETINTAIAQNQNLKLTYRNIINMVAGSMLIGGQRVYCVDIHLSDKLTANIPTELTFYINGVKHSAPVNFVQDIGDAKASAAPGDGLTNPTNQTAPGTLACILTDADQKSFYALSCCHVFTGSKWIQYTGYGVPANDIYDSNTGGIIGQWSFGVMNAAFDIGFVSINDTVKVNPSGLKIARDVTDNDIRHQTPVSFKGNVTKLGMGVISNYECSRDIFYGSDKVTIDNLILVSTSSGVCPSAPGDSGSLVYTAGANEPIGMIIATDTAFSYVIPIKSILSQTGKIIY